MGLQLASLEAYTEYTAVHRGVSIMLRSRLPRWLGGWGGVGGCEKESKKVEDF